MKKNILLLLFLIIYNPLFSQNDIRDILLFGQINKVTDSSITLNNLQVLNGFYDKDEITIKLSWTMTLLSPISDDWIGKYIIIETVYVDKLKSYHTSGKYGTWGCSQPALTPDGHTLYFLTIENNKKNGISSNTEDIIPAVQKATKVINIKDENEKLDKINNIICNSSEYMFIREYFIWELNKIRSNNTCIEIKKREIITSYIDNKKIPLYIRLKARDFYPASHDYLKYYHLLYDLKQTPDTHHSKYKNLDNYKSDIENYKEYYKRELLKKIEEENNIVEIIKQKLNK